MTPARMWPRSVLRWLVPLAVVLIVLGVVAVLTGGGASAWVAVIAAVISLATGVVGLGVGAET